jgi:hypothetical protein
LVNFGSSRHKVLLKISGQSAFCRQYSLYLDIGWINTFDFRYVEFHWYLNKEYYLFKVFL